MLLNIFLFCAKANYTVRIAEDFLWSYFLEAPTSWTISWTKRREWLTQNACTDRPRPAKKVLKNRVSELSLVWTVCMMQIHEKGNSIMQPKHLIQTIRLCLKLELPYHIFGVHWLPRQSTKTMHGPINSCAWSDPKKRHLYSHPYTESDLSVAMILAHGFGWNSDKESSTKLAGEENRYCFPVPTILAIKCRFRCSVHVPHHDAILALLSLLHTTFT